jgi:hypothetical protein
VKIASYICSQSREHSFHFLTDLKVVEVLPERVRVWVKPDVRLRERMRRTVEDMVNETQTSAFAAMSPYEVVNSVVICLHTSMNEVCEIQ